MKHAGPDALDKLESLLRRLRALDGLKEKSRGVFYRSARAFLHFHEDPSGLFADVRLNDDFERFEVSRAEQQRRLLKLVGDGLSPGGRQRRARG